MRPLCSLESLSLKFTEWISLEKLEKAEIPFSLLGSIQLASEGSTPLLNSEILFL